MAFFRAKLPDYSGYSLKDLQEDPVWIGAIRKAGWSIEQIEFWWRVGRAMIGTGPGSLPEQAGPALLLGRGDQLAIAFSDGREIRVVGRSRSNAELQTQRSGTFQITFGPVQRMDVWMLESLTAGTTEGDQFGRAMSAFFRGEAFSKPSSMARPEVTTAVIVQARAFMQEWTHIVGQASDPVFWDALARFGRIGGAVQGPALRAMTTAEIGAALDRPWLTWIEISRRANEAQDFELAAWIFFYSYTVVNQVTFDEEVAVACGYAQPAKERYHEIARQALVAANRAPDNSWVVERATESPVSLQAMRGALTHLLEVDG